MKGLIAEDITLQDYQQTYQEHDYGNFVNGMHRPDIETSRPGRIFPAKEVSENFVQFKKFL